MNSIQVGWVNTDNVPIKTEHVCFATSRGGEHNNEITLVEYLREYHPHPEAPEDATIYVLTSRNVRTYKVTDKRAAAALVLEAAQNNAAMLPRQG